jgi:hypothetical protein
VERSEIDVATVLFQGIRDSLVSSRLGEHRRAPALGITYFVNDNQQVRLSAAQTLSRPEYRELSGRVLRRARRTAAARQRHSGGADPELRRAMGVAISPAGETISLGAFYKRFRNPIERILVQNADGFSPDHFRECRRRQQLLGRARGAEAA